MPKAKWKIDVSVDGAHSVWTKGATMSVGVQINVR